MLYRMEFLIWHSFGSTAIKTKVQKCILFNEDEDEIISPSEIIDKIKRIDRKKIVAVKPDILKYGKDHIAKLQKTGNIGNSICYSCAINKLPFS